MCLLEKILPVRGLAQCKKGATNCQIYTKRVKFEGRIKGFSAEWENFIEGYFLKHFPWGKVAKNCQKFYTSASFEIFARFTKKYISEVISFNSRARIGYNTSCDRVGSGTKLYIAHTGWGQFYSVSGHTFYFRQFRPRGIFQVAYFNREVSWKSQLA